MTASKNLKKQRKAPSNPTIEVLTSLATIPVLAVLVGGKVLADAVNELGHLSEELFRGDRLPLLKFPVTSDPTAQTPDAD